MPRATSVVTSFFMRRDHNIMVLVLLTALMLAVAAFRVVRHTGFDHDEIEHGHVAWVMDDGGAPYRDIHQIHMPLHFWAGAAAYHLTGDPVQRIVLLRLLSLACFGVAVAAGIALLRLLGQTKPLAVPVFLCFALSTLVQFEFYRFRPDPFMAASAAWALAFYTRAWITANRRALFLGSVLLGLAAGFSPKMFPLLILAPVVAWRTGRRLDLALLGGILGGVPVIAYLTMAGLWPDFWRFVIVRNQHTLNLDDLVATMPTVCAATVMVAWSWYRGAFLPAGARFVAFALLVALTIPVVEPAHLGYNLQASAVPAAVVATLVVLRAAIPVYLTLPAALFILYQPLVVEGLDLSVRGSLIEQESFAAVNGCVHPGDTCAGFAPYHPAFCRDATDLYLLWDLWLTEVPWMAEDGKAGLRVMWKDAVERMVKAPPVVIASEGVWRSAANDGLITGAQLDALRNFLLLSYRQVKLGERQFFVRADAVSRCDGLPPGAAFKTPMPAQPLPLPGRIPGTP